jgi:hypothetical protein
LSDATRIGDIDLGASDAEADKRLGEYFVTTPFVEEAMSGRRTLFLGRKGSGKSAVFRQFPMLIEEAGRQVGVVPVTPDQYAWAALKDYQEQGQSQQAAHRNAWKLTLAVQIASHLTSLNYSAHSDAENAAAALRGFLEQNFGEPTLSFGRATRVLTGLKQFNLTALGFGGGFARDDGPDIDVTPDVINKLFDLIEACVQEAGVVVLLDRLDEEWDGSPEAQGLLVGLLMAAKELNDRFGLSQEDVGLKILVFLRSDVYAGLRFDDKDKHRPTEQPLTWTSEQLREMVEKRLPTGLKVEDLFEAGDMRGRVKPFEYVVMRTFLRPREVLQFLEECIRRTPRDAELILKDSIREAEEQHSRWKVEDLKQEFLRVYPELNDLLDVLQQEYHRYESMDDLVELVRKATPELLEQRTGRELLEILFETSVIGFRLRDSGSVRYKSENLELLLPAEAAVYIHQSLRKGLNVVERRSRGGRQSDGDDDDEDDAPVEVT